MDVVPYNNDHNLDEESWFQIENFSKQSYFPDFLSNEFSSIEFDEVTRNDYDKIKLLLSVQGNCNCICMQKTLSSLFLKKRSFLKLGDVVEMDNCENLLVIKELPDAIYFREQDTLLFKNLSIISGIFNGIGEIYREATKEEVSNFLNQSFIGLSNDFSQDKVTAPNRRRIALALQTFSDMTDEDKECIIDYVKDYLSFDEKTKKFIISSDIDLKKLLYGIEQRYYTTPIGGKKRLANSVLELG